MANCLVTKLKAAVNNPDLPIFETMAQFTLDAITASGNASMTDDQKWALNHFFYQIGAIDNSGIYSKLEGLYMPLICGDVLAKALVDYKGGNDVDISTGKNVDFQNHGIIVDDSSTATTNTTMALSQSSYDGAVNSLSVAVMFTEPFTFSGNKTLNLVGFRKQTSDTMRYITAALASSSVFMGMFTQRATYNARMTFKGAVGTITQDGRTALFVNDTLLESNGSSQSPTDPEGLNYVYLLWNDVVPIGIYAYGSALSSSERSTLGKAMRELVQAFVTVTP